MLLFQCSLMPFRALEDFFRDCKELRPTHFLWLLPKLLNLDVILVHRHIVQPGAERFDSRRVDDLNHFLRFAVRIGLALFQLLRDRYIGFEELPHQLFQ